MRLHSTRPGSLNWLLLPGGPGIGSESLIELADALHVPGSIWLIDLPGDGSNTTQQRDPYAQWPQVLVEAAQAVPHAVYVGHSTGGMYLLSTPALGDLVQGIALLDTAPDSSWHPEYIAMTQADPLPAFEHALIQYTQHPSIDNLTTLAVTSAEWNFTPAALEAGRALLARMPYNADAVAWSDAHFDHVYKATWWPTHVPVLRLYGTCDRIVSQRAWSAAEFNTPNVLVRAIADAGHFPWIDNPADVSAAFAAFAGKLIAG
ncbi:alpha/beta hydrolase [Dyella sp. C11]|uniref:alpha/beta fold hydrolase n=1 Tax=Dyella sp. C11 TaxID=2126991 RepID=UPI00130033AD|nr:alpha/beta hydrolase [Dyella sp. C11]